MLKYDLGNSFLQTQAYMNLKNFYDSVAD